MALSGELWVKQARVVSWPDVGDREAALIQRCAAGDESASAELVAEHQRTVVQLATNLLGYGVRQQPESARRASPIAHVSKDAPPCLFLHGDEDPLVPHAQSEALHRALTAAGARRRSGRRRT